MSWLVYVFFAVNFFAISNLFDKFFVSKRFKNIYSFAVVLNILYIVFNLGIGIYLRNTFTFGWPFFWSVAAGLVFFLMWIFWWKGLTTGEVSRLAAIFFTQPVFVAFLATIFLKEPISGLKWLAIIMIVIGGFMSSYENKKTKSKFNKAYLFVLLATIFASFGNIFSKFAMVSLPALTVQVIGFFSALPFYLLFLKDKKVFAEVKSSLKNARSFSLIFLRTLIGFLAICSFMLAIGAGPVSFVSALDGVQPLIILVYSTLISIFWPKIIKEEISKGTLFYKAVAIILIVIGAVIISL